MLGIALVDIYAKCSAMEKSCKVLEQLPARDVVFSNVMISGYRCNGLGDEAFQ